MIYNMYSIKDKKSDFAAPVPVKDHDTAKRWFDHEVKSNPFMSEYCEDFEMYWIGTFNAETAEIDRIPFPELVSTAEEVMLHGKGNAIQNTNE